jgi:hypothetical protein
MLSVRLPGDLEEQLTAHCAREGVSKTRFVTRALQRELAAPTANAYELLQYHLKGAKGEARDASENVSAKIKAKLRRKNARAQRAR